MSSKRMFLVMLAAIALVIGGTALAYVKTRQQLKAKAENLSLLKAEVDAIDDSVEDVKEVLGQYEDLDFIDQIATEVLPPEKVQSDLISQIYALANESGVTISTLNFTSPEGTPTTDSSLTQTKPLEGVSGVFVLPVVVSYQADNYSNFITLLRKFEDNRRTLQVSRLDVNPINASSDAGSQVIGYQGNLEINVYVRP